MRRPPSEVKRTPNSGVAAAAREPRAHGRILDATRALLEEVGYAGVTMEAVAKRADVGKPTLYRWWQNKAALVHESLLLPYEQLDFVSTGHLELDLRMAIESTVHFFARPLVQRAWLGVVVDLRADAGAHEQIYETWMRPAVEHIGMVLAAAAERGECRPDADPAAVVDAMLGMCIFEMTLPAKRGRPQATLASSILALVMHGVAVPAAQRKLAASRAGGRPRT